jgi:hypothetical protein
MAATEFQTPPRRNALAAAHLRQADWGQATVLQCPQCAGTNVVFVPSRADPRDKKCTCNGCAYRWKLKHPDSIAEAAEIAQAMQEVVAPGPPPSPLLFSLPSPIGSPSNPRPAPITSTTIEDVYAHLCRTRLATPGTPTGRARTA